jgi:hypothetical protein
MQQTQQTPRREASDQISWARAMIFAIGFFFIAALLVGQIPSYIFAEITSASLLGAEQAAFALGIACIATFIVIQVIVLLFDPKPVVPPAIFPSVGGVLALVGLAIMLLSVLTGCTPEQSVCNQYFPTQNMSILPLLGGNFLWFQPQTFDLTMIGTVILGIGAATIFYGLLAMGEQRNPDRRDIGTTAPIRLMIILAAVLLVAFLLFYTYVSDTGLGHTIIPGHPFRGTKLVDLILSSILGLAIFMSIGAFAWRLHYLMRPTRKRTMSAMYGIGALGFAQLGAILLLFAIFVYPLIDWIHSWTFLGLGNYLTLCAIKTQIPGSCAFTQAAAYIVDTIVTSNFFLLLAASIWAWKSHRNLVVVGGVATAALLAISTLLAHMHPDELLISMLLCGGILVFTSIWTSVARREFAVVGENNLGCMGMWLVVGTCLFVYLAAFAFFSIPGFHETEPNVPFSPGLLIPSPATATQPQGIGAADAVFMLILMAILAGIQFFFLVRNRYRV